jgi:signal transduction histidine kinase
MSFRGKSGGFIAFVGIAALVAGGLGWVTSAALSLEREQLQTQAQAQTNDRLRLAMWRLDSLISPLLAKEDSRPVSHFKSLFAPSIAINRVGVACEPGSVLEPSPLLSVELPDWMLLHFQTDGRARWESPQVLTPASSKRFQTLGTPPALVNVTPDRRRLLSQLGEELPVSSLMTAVRGRGEQHALVDTGLVLMTNESNTAMPVQSAQGANFDSEYANRAAQQAQLRSSAKKQQESTFPTDEETRTPSPIGDNSLNSLQRNAQAVPVNVTQSSMVPLWIEGKDQVDRLIFARYVQVGKQELCQGIVLDWPKLRTILATEVKDLFPEASFRPMKEDVPARPERTMTALPIELQAEPLRGDISIGWTPLRVGLAMSWCAALVALLAVGLGGWSLIDLSERRIRFVSAVTHELRTPLTTLRLYLDMLSGGMVKEERQQEEYLHTLNDEADRLNRLVGNVLDFSRLERQRPRLAMARINLNQLLNQVATTWASRCKSAGKELVQENRAGDDVEILTDIQIAQQILGNLIDNACKYSHGSADRRIWLRASNGKRNSIVIDVEDRGPGIPARERRAIFRPFRRGSDNEVAAGGVGLGLSLAQRWAHVLGGSLTLDSVEADSGACFRLTLPIVAHATARQ